MVLKRSLYRLWIEVSGNARSVHHLMSVSDVEKY